MKLKLLILISIIVLTYGVYDRSYALDIVDFPYANYGLTVPSQAQIDFLNQAGRVHTALIRGYFYEQNIKYRLISSAEIFYEGDSTDGFYEKFSTNFQGTTAYPDTHFLEWNGTSWTSGTTGNAIFNNTQLVSANKDIYNNFTGTRKYKSPIKNYDVILSSFPVFTWLNSSELDVNVSIFSHTGNLGKARVTIGTNAPVLYDVTTSGDILLVPPGATIKVEKLTAEPFTVRILDFFENTEPVTYDEDSIVNILSPNDYTSTVTPFVYVTFNVKYSRLSMGRQILFKRNNGMIFSPIEFSPDGFITADNSTLTEINKTYRVPITLVANSENKIEIYTKSVLGATSGSKIIHIIHKPFVDANGDGKDDITLEDEYDGPTDPLDSEPSNPIEAIVDGQMPEVKDIVSNLKSATGNFSYFLTSIFGFLPPEMIALMTFGLAMIIILRIVGR